MNVGIVWIKFFSADGKERIVGGVETYIENLCYLCMDLGHTPIIYQTANECWEKDYNGIKVIGIKCNTVNVLYNKALKDIDISHDLLIFASDFYSVNVRHVKGNIMSIQHGIWWDIPKCEHNKFISFGVRVRDVFNALRTYNHTRYRVCVDYNVYNWFKTMLPFRIPQNIKIIPNFTQEIISDKELDEKMKRLSSGKIKMIFARRFFKYRGALLFANVMKRVLERHPELKLTIAGEGVLENEMKEILKDYDVIYTKYDPKDSYKIHYDNDIAVIPTIASEGTSLSLIEAMGAGCLVVATPVGGMSNVVIDEFNGLITMPDEESLEKNIEKAISLVKDINIREEAVKSVRKSFSLDKWRREWAEVINKYANETVWG